MTVLLDSLPTPKDEAWKYTNLGVLRKMDFVPAGLPSKPSVPEGILGVEAIHAVVINGLVKEDFSAGDLPAGISLEVGRETTSNEVLPLVDLNRSGSEVGLSIKITQTVKDPLHLVFVAQADGSPALAQPHVSIRLAEGASATILESHVGSAGGTVFTNMVTDIQVEQGACLHHYRFQNDAPENTHIATVLATVGQGAIYDNFTLLTGAALCRNEIRVTLTGKGATCRLNGAYRGEGKRHMDTTLFVDHAVPNALSSQVYKGVLDGSSRGVFQGKVLVRRDAQGTDGRQLHKALLLSPKAEVDCKPELEIYADDVKCSHGATVGELDEEQLFYLRTRGLAEEEARALLIDAFLADAIDHMEEETFRDAFKEALK